MNYFFKSTVVVFFLFCVQNFSFGQDTKKINFPIKKSTSINQKGELQIKSEKFRVFELDIQSLLSDLRGVMKTTEPIKGFIGQIELPHPDGETFLYNVKLNTTMSEELQEKFPQIRSYDAYGVDFPAKAKIDITQHGFHAMIMQPNENTIFIDPAIKGETSDYIVYKRKDFKTENNRECYVTSEQNDNESNDDVIPPKSYLTCELRTYRFALAATVEYTDFHGGTKADAIAAQVTTMNRVNGIYERDLGVTMTIIPNNDLIVYEGDPASDPFSNGDAFAMLNENQTNTDAVIGSANYDIGHVFGTNSGGVAGLGVICIDGQKARGVTGSASPINDPFDVDYVAHEIGHQFGANHTQNNGCNRNNATAMEPGSASTILGYAGICAPDVQNNSDDHFHGISLEEMGNRVSATTCAVETTLDNSAPIITGTNAGVNIPASTPFALTAFADDADGDILSYCWEQMDNEVTTQPPVSTATGGPNFRSISPVNNPTRYFPNLQSLAAGGPFTWEVIPTVDRTMNFRLSVRDQPLNVAGCNDFTDVTITTVASAGPFVVLYPSATGITWEGLDNETVTWDVANTDVDPINCENVDIFLSTDGGLTYPFTLATNVPNTGSAIINVPNEPTITARVMVMCSSGTFFDISDNNFQIIEASFDFTLSVDPLSVNVCEPTSAVYSIDIGSLDGYNDPVDLTVSDLPAGAVATFSNETVTPPGTTTLTISNIGGVTPGAYNFTIEATSTTGTKFQQVELIVSSSSPSPVTLLSPTNGEDNVNAADPLTWTDSPEVGVTFEIQIATDDAFTNIIDQATGLTETSFTSNELNPSSTYFWRVRAVTACGESAWTDSFVFSTDDCYLVYSTNVPVAIPSDAAATVTSTLTVPNSGIINDLNVIDLIGTHTWINDLIVSVTSPSETTVVLWENICNNEDNFDVNFDDDAALTELPCPPVGGGTYQPQGTLADFNGENAQGDWILTIQDVFAEDGGSLNSWALEICAEPTFDYTLAVSPESVSICPPDEAIYTIDVGSLDGYNDPVDLSISGLPAGAVATFSDETVTPAGTSTLTISNTGAVAPGTYAISVQGNSTSGVKVRSIELIVGNTNPDPVTLADPTDTEVGVSLEPTFTWTASIEPGTLYEIEIASDPAFTTIVGSANDLADNSYTTTELSPGTVYYWRVRYTSTCGASDWSSIFTFTTSSCVEYSATDVPIAIPNVGTITSTINVPPGENILNVNITGLVGTHARVNHLSISLTSPQGTTVNLVDFGACPNGSTNFNLAFSDDGLAGPPPCPPTDGDIYQPTGVLGDFNGENPEGNWVLTVVDDSNPFGGELQNWSLEICTEVGSECIEASAPIVEGDLSICEGSSTTLNISSGSLNDAETWEWFTSDCGATPVGTGTELTVTPSATTTYYVRGEGGCTSGGICTSVTVTVNPEFNETDEVTICSNESYTFGTQTLTTAGEYTETFSSISGCDSTVTLTLNVNPEFNETDEATICSNESYVFGTQTLTSVGDYTETFTSIDGCDSTVTLTLNVNPVYNETDATTICANETYSFGTQTLSTSGDYTQVFASVNGCDSTVVLTLTVNPVYNETASATICDGSSYTFGTQTLTTAGDYTEVFSSQDGCDSTVVLSLSVVTEFTETDEATICSNESYVFGTQTLTTAGEYTETFSSVSGCDSTVTLTLNVNPEFNQTDEVTICANETYIFGTQTLTSAGDYTETFTSIDGCDSTVTITLNVNPVYNETDATTICANETYSFGTQTLNTSGDYTEVFASVNGCDSTVVLTLTVNSVYNETASATICDGSSYTFGTQTLTTAGDYTEVFSSQDGCDSTVVLSLSVVTEFTETDEATICANDSYTFGTQTLTTAGEYTKTFTSISGCDSTVTLTLNVNPEFNETDEATICSNESYVFGTQTLTSAGDYTETFTSIDGCDSIVTLTLTVINEFNETDELTICYGDFYSFGSQSLNESGEYTETFTSVNGCDSTVVLTMTVTEELSVEINQSENQLFATEMNATYQWIDCDSDEPIDDATEIVYEPSEAGFYAVEISLGSCSVVSDCYNFEPIDIEIPDFDPDVVNVFPNPTIDEVTITWIGEVDRIEVTDFLGKIVYRYPSVTGTELEIDFRNLEGAVYHISIFSDKGRHVYEVVKL